MLGEPVAIDVLDACARHAAVLFHDMEKHVLARGVVPKEEGLPVLGAAFEEIDGMGQDLVVDRLHAFSGQRAFVDRRAVDRARYDTARIELLAELRIGRPVGVFEILVGVEVVEIAEVLIEAVAVRQLVLEVAEMVLAELGGRVALRLEDFGKRDVFLLQARRRTRRSHGRQARADG